jgi:hypothetical protein
MDSARSYRKELTVKKTKVGDYALFVEQKNSFKREIREKKRGVPESPRMVALRKISPKSRKGRAKKNGDKDGNKDDTTTGGAKDAIKENENDNDNIDLAHKQKKKEQKKPFRKILSLAATKLSAVGDLIREVLPEATKLRRDEERMRRGNVNNEANINNDEEEGFANNTDRNEDDEVDRNEDSEIDRSPRGRVDQVNHRIQWDTMFEGSKQSAWKSLPPTKVESWRTFSHDVVRLFGVDTVWDENTQSELDSDCGGSDVGGSDAGGGYGADDGKGYGADDGKNRKSNPKLIMKDKSLNYYYCLHNQ